MYTPHSQPTRVDEATSGSSKKKLELRAVSKSFGSVLALHDISLSLREGQLLALLGPSGCGKTTTLRLVAGLEKPTGGEIIIDGKLVANAGMSVEPEMRKLGMVFQSYAIWPHMTVFDNVAYGLRRTGYARSDVVQRVTEILQVVGMPGYEKRPATDLSGGQQQRVAVARALATRPTILLFDEPLSNLDAVLRESMRFEIRSLQQRLGITAIYVTHSQDEALAIADVVGVMNAGRIEQIAAPEELYDRPRNRFVASFVGLANILHAVVEAVGPDKVRVAFNGGIRRDVERPSTLADSQLVTGKRVSVAVRPENMKINMGKHDEDTGDEAIFAVPSTVVTTVYSGNLIDYFVDTGDFGGQVRVQAMPPVVARPGDHVVLTIASRNCTLLED